MHTISLILHAPDGYQEIVAELEQILNNRDYSICSRTEQQYLTNMVAIKQEIDNGELSHEPNLELPVEELPPVVQTVAPLEPQIPQNLPFSTKCNLPYLSVSANIECTADNNTRINTLSVGNLYTVGNDNCFFTYCNSFYKFPIAKNDANGPVIKCLVVFPELDKRIEAEILLIQKNDAEAEKMIIGTDVLRELSV